MRRFLDSSELREAAELLGEVYRPIDKNQSKPTVQKEGRYIDQSDSSLLKVLSGEGKGQAQEMVEEASRSTSEQKEKPFANHSNGPLSRENRFTDGELSSPFRNEQKSVSESRPAFTMPEKEPNTVEKGPVVAAVEKPDFASESKADTPFSTILANRQSAISSSDKATPLAFPPSAVTNTPNQQTAVSPTSSRVQDANSQLGFTDHSMAANSAFGSKKEADNSLGINNTTTNALQNSSPEMIEKNRIFEVNDNSELNPMGQRAQSSSHHDHHNDSSVKSQMEKNETYSEIVKQNWGVLDTKSKTAAESFQETDKVPIEAIIENSNQQSDPFDKPIANKNENGIKRPVWPWENREERPKPIISFLEGKKDAEEKKSEKETQAKKVGWPWMQKE